MKENTLSAQLGQAKINKVLVPEVCFSLGHVVDADTLRVRRLPEPELLALDVLVESKDLGCAGAWRHARISTLVECRRGTSEVMRDAQAR